jgi:hypothetical protein
VYGTAYSSSRHVHTVLCTWRWYLVVMTPIAALCMRRMHKGCVIHVKDGSTDVVVQIGSPKRPRLGLSKHSKITLRTGENEEYILRACSNSDSIVNLISPPQGCLTHGGSPSAIPVSHVLSFGRAHTPAECRICPVGRSRFSTAWAAVSFGESPAEADLMKTFEIAMHFYTGR